MKTLKLTLPLLALTGLVLAGCPADDAPPVDEGTSTDATTTGSPTTTPTNTDPDTTAGTDAMTSATTAGSESSTTGEEVGPYEFDETDFADYTAVDRMGFPAVNTGLNLLGDKDAYNAATPEDDAALMFATNIFESLETLHLGIPGMQTPDNTGLDDDLATLGIPPCVTPPLPMDSCDDQGGPFAIPDTLVIDLDDPAGFPNGRALPDPVMDIIFAVLLLDLEGGVPIDTLLNVPLNPTENDVEFAAGFPYLAPAHE